MYLSEYFRFCKIDCNFATDFARLCGNKLLYSTQKLANIVSIQNVTMFNPFQSIFLIDYLFCYYFFATKSVKR